MTDHAQRDLVSVRHSIAAALVCSLLLNAGIAAYLVFGLHRQRADAQLTSGGAPLTPSAAWTNANRWLEHPRGARNFAGLAPQLERTLTSNVQGTFSLYLEDLASAACVGVREDESYNAWSLLKVAVMVTVLKKVETGQLSLAHELTLAEKDMQTVTVVPVGAQAGDRVTVMELVSRLIRLSDNTASFVLARLFKATEFQRALLATGLPPAPPGKPLNYLPPVSPRQFASVLRSLHSAAYLRRPMSDVALALMADTVYDSQIRMGLPDGTKVAHKVGFNASCGDFHDCGIVYAPGGAYVLCVMSTGSTREESDRIISQASRQIYAHAAARAGGRSAWPCFRGRVE